MAFECFSLFLAAPQSSCDTRLRCRLVFQSSCGLRHARKPNFSSPQTSQEKRIFLISSPLRYFCCPKVFLRISGRRGPGGEAIRRAQRFCRGLLGWEDVAPWSRLLCAWLELGVRGVGLGLTPRPLALRRGDVFLGAVLNTECFLLDYLCRARPLYFEFAKPERRMSGLRCLS